MMFIIITIHLISIVLHFQGIKTCAKLLRFTLYHSADEYSCECLMQ